MKKTRVMGCLIFGSLFMSCVYAGNLTMIEREVQKNMQLFNDLSRTISIADLSQSIVSHDSHILKTALHDVMDLNQMVNAQVNTSIQLWNMYLDSVKVPSMETYLLGQVMNSIITAMRAITLRCSVDQSMILSLVKKHFNDQEYASRSDFNRACDISSSRIESRWRSLYID